ISGSCNFPTTHGTSLLRRWASSTFVVLVCVLVQSCQNSDNGLATQDPPRPDLSSAKDRGTVGPVRIAERVQATTPDLFVDRFSGVEELPLQPAHDTTGNRTATIRSTTNRAAQVAPAPPVAERYASADSFAPSEMISER